VRRRQILKQTLKRTVVEEAAKCCKTGARLKGCQRTDQMEVL
jgi:hypothetical protein